MCLCLDKKAVLCCAVLCAAGGGTGMGESQRLSASPIKGKTVLRTAAARAGDTLSLVHMTK